MRYLVFLLVLFSSVISFGAGYKPYYSRVPNGTTIRNYHSNGTYAGRSYYYRNTYRNYGYNGVYSGRVTVGNGYYRYYGANGVYQGSSSIGR